MAYPFSVPSIGKPDDIGIGGHHVDFDAFISPAAERCAFALFVSEALLTENILKIAIAAIGADFNDTIHIQGWARFRSAGCSGIEFNCRTPYKHELVEDIAQSFCYNFQFLCVGCVQFGRILFLSSAAANLTSPVFPILRASTSATNS